MKILIVNTSDAQGGAARAAYRLHGALLKQNIDSQMLVQNNSSHGTAVIGPQSKTRRVINILRPLLDDLPIKLYKQRSKTFFGLSWLPFSDIIKQINDINPDVVHLHWISHGMLRIEDIKKINAPIVWTLHDMWSFTGGCGYSGDCTLYQEECMHCPVLGSKKKYDLSTFGLRRKDNIYAQTTNLTIVALSKWLEKCARKSKVLKNKKIINLPNPIDTILFKSNDKKTARKTWNLPINQRLILFGAINATSNPRKGFNELVEALQKIDNKDIELVVFGQNQIINEIDVLGFKIHYIETLHDNISLITLYNAVDVMVVPSLEENLSNVIMESLSCALPVVGFDIGGNSDMIEHEVNGYLAKPKDTLDLSRGIAWIINHANYDSLCQNARNKVMREFDSVIVANKYLELYEDTLKESYTKVENEK